MSIKKSILDDLGAPPVLPTLGEQLESYLLRPDRLPIHGSLNQPIGTWDRTPNPQNLLKVQPAPLATTLRVKRDPSSGTLYKK